MRHLIETLETRSLLSASVTDTSAADPASALSAKTLAAQSKADAKAAAAQAKADAAQAKAAAAQAKADAKLAAQQAKLESKLASADSKAVQDAASETNIEYNLSADQVTQLLEQAIPAMHDGQAVAIVDREGVILGVFKTPTASAKTVKDAIERARTGAYFESAGEAFTSRTARFIIQNHFPFPVRNTPGGPLYGVQFSSLPGSDIVPQTPVLGLVPGYISGDPGGLPLYIGGVPAGGIGVAGDNQDTAPIDSLQFPGQKIYSGKEESDYDESVAISASRGLAASPDTRIDAEAPKKIQATNVILANTGLRFPYTASPAAPVGAFMTLDEAVAAGKGSIIIAPTASPPNPYPKVPASVYGVAGELKNTTVPGYGIIPSNDTDASGTLLPDSQRLTVDDVNTIIKDAVHEAINVRAGIRLPRGRHAVVHIAVVDRDGTVLGVFRMADGTNFSWDVAVQKARTAAFFSDDTHAFSTRAIGFMAQKFFPSGIDGGSKGPLYLLQDAISDAADQGSGPLADGITVFPGGIPLYKDGVMVGAIGISGDGVEEDDEISYGGAAGFRPPPGIRSDELGRQSVHDFIVSKVQEIVNMKDTTVDFVGRPITTDFVAQADRILSSKAFSDFELPFVKFKRHAHLYD